MGPGKHQGLGNSTASGGDHSTRGRGSSLQLYRQLVALAVERGYRPPTRLVQDLEVQPRQAFRSQLETAVIIAQCGFNLERVPGRIIKSKSHPIFKKRNGAYHSDQSTSNRLAV
jgi:hypothetical protein